MSKKDIKQRLRRAGLVVVNYYGDVVIVDARSLYARVEEAYDKITQAEEIRTTLDADPEATFAEAKAAAAERTDSPVYKFGSVEKYLHSAQRDVEISGAALEADKVAIDWPDVMEIESTGSPGVEYDDVLGQLADVVKQLRKWLD